MSDSVKTRGQVAFEAYRRQVVTAVSGEPIPEWDEVPENIRNGWHEAASAAWDHGHTMRRVDAEFERRDSRWVPLADVLPTRAEADGPLLLAEPVSSERAAEAAGSVPVEADDETADDAP